MSQSVLRELAKRLLFSLAAVVLLWLLAEAGLVVMLWLKPFPKAEVRALYGPHPYRAFAGIPNTINLDGTKRLNSLGLRNPEIEVKKPPNTLRIVCLGGSTTWSEGATTNSHTYPARMEVILRERYRDAPFRIEVINGGLPSLVTLDSLMLFQTTLLDFSPDIAVCHHGLNDCWFLMDFRGFSHDLSHARKTFGFPPQKFWEISPLLSYFFAKGSIANPYFPDYAVNLNLPIITQPELLDRDHPVYRDDLEPQMLVAFERHTRAFVSVAKANGVFIVLSTQGNEDDLLNANRWTRAMTLLNRATCKVAAQESVPVIDFARLLPWNREDYYDAVHLRDTPGGLGRQAEIFADGMIQSGTIEKAAKRLASRTD